jgi:hypothetical protein
MSMFDDLDPDFPIVKPADAAASVATRARQIRTHRQLLVAGAALPLVAIVLAVSIAFASPSSSPSRLVVEGTTTTTSVGRSGHAHAHPKTRTKPVSSPVTISPTTTTVPRKPHGNGGGGGGGGGGGVGTTTTTLGPVHSEFDWSKVVTIPSLPHFDLTQGSRTSVDVKVTNSGSWNVLLDGDCGAPLYLDMNFEGQLDPRCQDSPADSLAPGASLTRSFDLVAVHFSQGAPLVRALAPGDYGFVIPYVNGVPVIAHVTSALTYSLSSDTVTLSAGSTFTVQLNVTSSTFYIVDVDELPDRCTQIPPAPQVVCGSLDNDQQLEGPDNTSLSDTVGMNTTGLAPGTYQVPIGPETLTLTIT